MSKDFLILASVSLISLGLLFLLLKQWAISSEYFPTRLSDFAFIIKQGEKLAEASTRLLQSDKYTSEFQLIGYLLKTYVVTLVLVVVSLLYTLITFV